MNAPLALVAPALQPPPRARLPASVRAAAAAAAEEVDERGRFPAEAVDEARVHGLLGALVPVELGGLGLGLRQVAAQCQELGGACSSAAMVLAMHHIQVACLLRHGGGSPWTSRFLQRVAGEGLLLASATSERDVGGDLRSSLCALRREGERFTLEKDCTTISYGAYADAVLATARATPDAAAGDQVLVVLEASGLALERTAGWDAMGMRGTVSDAFLLRGAGALEQVLPVRFSEIAGATMAPVSHILWGAVWTGVAAEALDRARRRLKSHASRQAVSAAALRLVRAVEVLQLARGGVRAALDAFERPPETAALFGDVVAHNALKAGVADACLEVAHHALAVCGAAGYGRKGPASVSRQLRDLHSAPLMIANERLRETSARLLLAQAPTLALD